MDAKKLSANDLEDLAFCEYMRQKEPWALEQWKQAWRIETNTPKPPKES